MHCTNCGVGFLAREAQQQQAEREGAGRREAKEGVRIAVHGFEYSTTACAGRGAQGALSLLGFAPYRSNSVEISCAPCSSAMSSADMPLASWRFGSAPAASSTSTASWKPIS